MIFWELSGSRPSTGMGPTQLPWSEIKAWCELFEEKLDRWELNMIHEMDRAYVKAVSSVLDKD